MQLEAFRACWLLEPTVMVTLECHTWLTWHIFDSLIHLWTASLICPHRSETFRICRACRNLWLPDYLIPRATSTDLSITKRSAGRDATSLESDLSHVDRPHDLTKWHRRCSSTILRSAATNILKAKTWKNYHCLMKKSAKLWVWSLFFFPELPVVEVSE